MFHLMTKRILANFQNQFLALLCLWVKSVLVFALFPLTAIGQVETKSAGHVANFIGSDAAAVVHVDDFPELLRAVVTHSAFENPNFSKLIKTIHDNDREFGGRLDGFLESLETCKQVHLVVWSPETTEMELNRENSVVPRWLNSEIAILINSTKPDAVSESIGFLQGFFSIARDEQASEANESTPDKSDAHSTLTTLVHDDWVIAASSAVRATQLKELFAGSATVDKSLMTDRSYQLVLKQFEKMSEPLVVAYVKPKCFPSVFGLPNGEQEDGAEIIRLSETPAAGFGVSFLDDPNSILIKAITKCKLPESGLALEWTARRTLPRPLPNFEFAIDDVTAEAWDPEALALAKRKNMERVRGEGSYAESLEKEFHQELASIVDQRSSERYTITYTGPNGMTELVDIDRVASWEAMKLFLEHEVKTNNKGKPKGDVEYLTLRNDSPETDSTAIVYGASAQNRQKHVRESLRLAESSRKNKRFLETFYKPAIDNGETLETAVREYAGSRGWVLTEDWLFDGHLKRIFQQIDAVNNDKIKTSGFDAINDKVEWLTLKSGTDWPALLWYGRIIIWKVKHAGLAVLQQKYSNEDREHVAKIWDSVSKYESENESEGDLHDVLGWHVIEMIAQNCNGVLICRPPKPVGKGTQETVYGVFFEQP